MYNLLKEKKIKLALFTVLAFILLINNWSVSLWDQDESAYAGFGSTMNETGDYLIPSFTWSDVHRKPPLHFWLIAGSQKVFGANEFATRFPVSVAIFLVYLLIYFQGKKFFGEKTAIYAVVILGTSFFIPALGKIAVTDGLLLLFHTLAGFSLLNILENKSYKWVAIFWFSFAMGILVKGPPIMIFTGFLTILLFACHKKRMNLIVMHPWFFMPLAFIPFALWGYAAWQYDDGKFLTWMYEWYILKRVGDSVFDQTGPPGYYLVNFFVFFLTYLTFLPGALFNAFKSLKTKSPDMLSALAWLIASWLFYEFISSKLPAYVIASYPILVIIIAKQIINAEQENSNFSLNKIASIFQLIISLAISVGLIYGGYIYLSLTGFIIATSIALIFFIGTLLALVNFWKQNSIISIKYFMGNALVFVLLIWTVLMPQVNGIKNSTKRTAEYVKNNISETTTIIISNNAGHPPSLPFYLHQKNLKSQIIEDYNEKSLINRYQSDSSFVFILNKSKLDMLIKQFGNLDTKRITSLSSDRKASADYYILKN